MAKRWRVGLILLTTFAVGCTATSVPNRTVDQSTDTTIPRQESEIMRDEWNSLGITDYEIVYSIRNLNGMGGSPGDGVYSVVVHDGVAIECSVEEAPLDGSGDCVFMLAAATPYPAPVDMLFGRLASWDSAFTTVRYNLESVPVYIYYDEPDLVDEEYAIRVIEFQATRD